MAIDPRTPVIVGVGQIGRSVPGAREPLDLMEHAIEAARDDCGRRDLVARADLVGVARSGTVRYADAAGALAMRYRLPNARTIEVDFGGHMAQVLVAEVAGEIAAGRSEVALIAGAEMGSLLRLATPTAPTRDGSGTASATIGDDIATWISHPHEAALGMTLPVQVYPLLETALAWDRGEALGDHMRRTAELWSRFADVAAANPHAQDHRPHPAGELFPATPANRFVGYPYTKLMCSDQFVDQACALLLCSSAAADAAGIAADRRIYPIAAAEASSGFVSHRASLSRAPALACAGDAVAELVGAPLREADFVDLYACFPAAVQIQARALGFDLDRPLTVTGGMRFAGGPWNSYALHMIANLALRLREAGQGWAVASGNGGLATRFSLGVYAAQPAAAGYRRLAERYEPHASERCALDENPTGDARIEAFSLMHDRSNCPREAFVACRTDDGARAWARFDDEASLSALLALDRPDAVVRFAAGRAALRQ